MGYIQVYDGELLVYDGSLTVDLMGYDGWVLVYDGSLMTNWLLNNGLWWLVNWWLQ